MQPKTVEGSESQTVPELSVLLWQADPRIRLVEFREFCCYSSDWCRLRYSVGVVPV